MQWKAALVLAVAAILAWVRTRGMAAGVAKERKEGAVVAEQYEVEVADAELEEKRASGVVARLRGVRDRASRRRDKAD